MPAVLYAQVLSVDCANEVDCGQCLGLLLRITFTSSEEWSGCERDNRVPVASKFWKGAEDTQES